jgi:thioredoxin reductase
MFSPWVYNIDGAARRLLDASGWRSPDLGTHPTGADLIRAYLEPLAGLAPIRKIMHFGVQVRAIGRQGFGKIKTAGRDAAPFEIAARHDGRDVRFRADAVIDISGTWSSPNPAGSAGLPAVGEAEAAAHVRYSMPDVMGRDRLRYAGRRVAVVGSGHSAIGTMIELAELAGQMPATEITWLFRGPDITKALGGGAADKLAERGALGDRIAALIAARRISVLTGFGLGRIVKSDAGLILEEEGSLGRSVGVDELVVATGFRPDTSVFRELRVSLDDALECPPALAPLIDPNLHSCGTVRPHGAAELRHPEAGFYIAGMKAYGRAPTFLLATGHEQVRSIVAEIAGDAEAARRVELVLPETGVCSLPGERLAAQEEPCCGGAPAADTDACCRADEIAKVEGKAGCGCRPQSQLAAE